MVIKVETIEAEVGCDCKEDQSLHSELWIPEAYYTRVVVGASERAIHSSKCLGVCVSACYLVQLIVTIEERSTCARDH